MIIMTVLVSSYNYLYEIQIYVKSSKGFFLNYLIKNGDYYNFTQSMSFIHTYRYEIHH